MEHRDKPTRYVYRPSLEVGPPLLEWYGQTPEIASETRLDLAKISAKTHEGMVVQFQGEDELTERFFIKCEDESGAMQGWREVRPSEDGNVEIVAVELIMYEPNPYGTSFRLPSVVLQQGYELAIVEVEAATVEAQAIVTNLGRMHSFTTKERVDIADRELEDVVA